MFQLPGGKSRHLGLFPAQARRGSFMRSDKETCTHPNPPETPPHLLDRMRAPVLLLDDQLQVLGVSTAFAERIHIPAEVIQGLPLSSAGRHFPLLATIAAGLRNAFADQLHPQNRDFTIQDPGGPLHIRTRWLRRGSDPPRFDLLVNLAENPSPPSHSPSAGDWDETLRFFQYAIDASPDGVFWMGRDGGFVYVNEQACRSLGYSREELLNLHLWDIDPTFSPSRWSAHWKEMRTLQSRLIETVHRRKDGTLFPIEVSAYRLPFGNEERHLAVVRDISERSRAAEALKKSEERYRLLFNRNPHPMWVSDLQTGAIVAVNRAAIRQYGYSEEEFQAMKTSDICLESDIIRPNAKPLAPDRHCCQRHRLKDGTLAEVEIQAHTLSFEGRRAEIVLIQDITERLRAEAERENLEAQLVQAQKMESIGRLAGGVAHDFNNMLSVILGYAELMRAKLAPGDPLANDLEQLQGAALRSKEMTAQLLAFSRKQIIEPRILDLNRLIRGLENTLARLIGEDIDLLFMPFEGLGNIEADPLQVEQILMNLAVNARDAMPYGGRLTIETANAWLDGLHPREHAGLPQGDFVRITIRDDGIGMTAETLDRVFEPFFTTKEMGKGTGLGLATVYGIVKQGNGFINVKSTPGRGTTFNIYLPMSMGEAIESETAVYRQPMPGSETLLLVEDDDMVRGIVKVMLENIGYCVIDAVEPEEAIAIFSRKHQAVDLLITDVVMPKMDGRAMHNRMQAIHPGLKVLYMSGYTPDVIVDHGVIEKGVHFIAKPFSMNDLARKVRSALETG